MHIEEKVELGLMLALVIAGITTLAFAQQEWGPYPMNATISQPICIQLSGNLSTGIFFTNKTTIGVQYPITDMTVANNATGNYWGASYGTVYWVSGCAGNTINISVYQSACENLKNGTNTIYLTYDAGDGGQGGFFANGTTATAPTLSEGSAWAFKVDDWVMLAEKVVLATDIVYTRYWLDPWPNSAPSGIYNTTYKVRGAEFNTSAGSGVC